MVTHSAAMTFQVKVTGSPGLISEGEMVKEAMVDPEVVPGTGMDVGVGGTGVGLDGAGVSVGTGVDVAPGLGVGTVRVAVGATHPTKNNTAPIISGKILW